MIQRARLFFFVCVGIAGLIFATSFPLTTLFGGRSTASAERGQIATLQATNSQLSSEVHALSNPATIGRVAQAQYGLVTPGQQSIVVLPGAKGTPGASAAGGSDPLGVGPVPASDLLPSDAILSPSVPAPSAHRAAPGLWHQVLSHLEFWR
jgi:hypothetical protein